MPWCPKCKNEYRKGVTVCVDCGTELVDEQPEMYDYSKLCTLEKEDVVKKLIKYLEFSNIIGRYEYDEAELGFVVSVRDDELKKAKKAFQAFYSVELEKLAEKEAKAKKDSNKKSETSSESNFENDSENGSSSLEEKAIEDSKEGSEDVVESAELTDSDDSEQYEGISEEEVELLQEKSKITKMMYDGGSYVKKSDKLKDLKSTAATFFFFSFFGLLIVVLNLCDILNFIGGTLQYCILIAMFVGFLVIGVNSVQRMKKVAKEVEVEEENTKKITNWLNTFITAETIKEFKDSSLSDEANFIREMDGIKALVVKEFGKMNDAYLDYITEEFYNNKFGEESFNEDLV